ncbi:MAG: hydrogenase maturation nickel metallochaperone HypA [Nitrospiraceae bacterium]|nr:hydrogenase maturation nickel metallochaperone HypA [Nitrospiraceae bacterium]
MCLAVPSKIISLENDLATIDVYGARKEVSVMLLPERPAIGDYVLVHAGFAIQTVRAEAFRTGEIMHESSIAHSILEIVEEQCAEKNCTVVDSLTVRLGKATGVMPESLQFAFDALKEPTAAKTAKMTIEIVPVGGRCNACNREFDVTDAQYIFACPHCGSDAFEVTRGREMEISEMEMH